LGAIGVSKKLFDLFRPANGDELPNDLIGAEITNIGTITFGDFKNDLLIEYKPNGLNTIKQLVLSYNERAMWISYHFSPASSGKSG
jgi:hypothetical protein